MPRAAHAPERAAWLPKQIVRSLPFRVQSAKPHVNLGLANGKKSNWGREMWQLVRTEQGWKIFSVVYTIRDQWSAAEG